MIEGSYFINPNDVVVKVNLPVEITFKQSWRFVRYDIVLHTPGQTSISRWISADSQK
jgi:hypothetical protein